jgi:uncharacterized cupredoxin-like copper-binding protein
MRRSPSRGIHRTWATATFAAIAALATVTACKRVEDERPPAAESGAPAAAESSATTSPAPIDSQQTAAGTAPAANASFPGASSVTYVATDYAFDGPGSLPAGLTTFRFENHGAELHHLVIIKLNGGKSAVDLAKAMQVEGAESHMPGWAVFQGGPVGIAPGAESNFTFVLDPGSYELVCLIPSPDGVSHMAKGMMRPVEVVAGEGAVAAPEPQADLTVKLIDYDFQLADSLTTGRHVVRVDNAGEDAHEMVIWQLPPGKSLADLTAWVDGGLQGPPPGRPVAGLSPMAPGRHGYFGMDLPAGDYALICFVPDDEDGKPHYAHGMAREITIH